MKKYILFLFFAAIATPLLSQIDYESEFQSPDYERTWRDSGYYFRFEFLNWETIGFRTLQSGSIGIAVRFNSEDPSGLRYRGEAIFQIDPDLWPANIMPARGMRGKSQITIAEDVLLCPSPTQEVGLGQNDPYFPLFFPGFLTEIMGIEPAEPIPMVMQLRDIEIIL